LGRPDATQSNVYMPFLKNMLHCPKYMTMCHFHHLLEEIANKHPVHITNHKLPHIEVDESVNAQHPLSIFISL
jgi:hypothetical protein